MGANIDTLHTHADNVKNYRLACGPSKEKPAEYAGIHRTYISAVEGCRRSIALGNIQKIATALHVETYPLFMDIPNEKENAK